MKRLAALLLALTTLAPSLAHAAEAAASDAPVQAPPSAPRVPPQRYVFAASGVLFLGGLGVSYWAQGQSLRAERLTSAADARDELQAARTSAATANAMYALAGLTLAYGLVLEFLPEQVAEKADLTFHF